MNVSFQGLHNLQIAKSRQVKKAIGLYPNINGEIKQGELAIKEYKLRLDITDDVQGKDYNELLLAMGKAGNGLNTDYFKGNPNKIELLTTEYHAVDDDFFDDYKFFSFKLNDENINLTNRGGLTLFTYLAKITRELKQNFTLSNEQKEVINKINRAIGTEAERFINIL